MAALSDNKEVQRKDGVVLAHKVVGSDIIYRGALVKINADGYLAPCAAEAGAVFAGIAYEEVDNSSGSAGDEECRVYKEGVFLLEGSGFAQADVGEAVYASDDQTVTKTHAANLQRVGVIVEFESSTKVWVKIEPAVLGAEDTIADAAGGATVDAEARTALNAALAVMRKHNMIAG